MMPVAKHGDMQLGVDIHLCLVPTPAPTPTPLPTPHTSIVFDPFDYVPVLGATITVCGMKRATAGTNGVAIHIPPGFPFAPKPPEKDDELFMGSATVVADGDPLSHIGHPVLACQVAGMMSPFRPKKKGGPKAMVLPTVFNLATPTSVFIGGPPTISLMGMAMKGIFSALGKLAKSGVFKRLRQKMFKNMKPGFLKCIVLRAEPVNILNGAVSVEQEDFTLPGRIPVEWIRTYSSADDHVGVCGPGWQTIADIRLELDPEDGSVLMQGPVVGPLSFERLPERTGDDGYVLELSDGARLSDHGAEWRVRTKDDRVYHFPRRLASRGTDGTYRVRIGRISDPCGNWLDFEYRDGQPAAINESAGRRIGLKMDRGKLIEVSLESRGEHPRHVWVRYEYDGDGDLVAVIDALGNPYTFGYDRHHMVRHTDRNGLSFYYEYDWAAADGWRVVHSWGDGGLYNYHFEYIDALNERRITDSLGHVSVVKLSEAGLPISEIDALGGMTVYEYDEAGRTTAVVDQCGHRTEYEYDERGNLLTLTRPDGATVKTTFDANDKPVIVTDPNGGEWQQRWNTNGLLVEVTTPLNNTRRYAYDRDGQLVAVTNARELRTAYRYDAVGNLIAWSDSAGGNVAVTVDHLGNVAFRLDELQRATRYRRDLKGRLLVVQRASQSTVEFDYDPQDNLIRYIDANGVTTTFAHTSQGQITARTQGDGRRVLFHYDAEERLTGVTNQRGERYAIERDATGRIVRETDYWGQARQYSYAPCGHLATTVDALGRSVSYKTDALGRIVGKMLPNEAGRGEPFVESFEYDANGNLVACTNKHTRVERDYDSEGRLVREKQGVDFVVSYSYDRDGNRCRRETHSKGLGADIRHVVDCEYDDGDRVVRIIVDGVTQARFERNARGEVLVEHLGASLTRVNEYSADGYTGRRTLHARGSPIYDVQYAYDRVGNLTERRDTTTGVEQFSHDDVGRLLRHIDAQGRLTAYQPDSAGDRLRTSVHIQNRTGGIVSTAEAPVSPQADAWLRVGTYDGATYAFDRTGALTCRGDGEDALRLLWDAGQRLVQSNSRNGRTTYLYDPLGRRIMKRTGNSETRFFWDGDILAGDLELESDGGGPEQLRGRHECVFYPDTHEPCMALVSDPGCPQVLFYHNDPNGQPSRVTDSVGNMVWLKNQEGDAALSDGRRYPGFAARRLLGQYEDTETGLCYNRHRYFDERISAFISQDPLGLKGGVALYQLGPNTSRWVDPLGLTCEVKWVPESLRHALDRHSPHRPPGHGGKGTPFPKAWSEAEFEREAERIANDASIPRVPVPPERGGVGWTKEASVAINGETRVVRVIGEVPDPAIPGTGPGVITSAYPPHRNK